MILTKKLTAALLSILIAIAFMPSMTFASGGGGTGTVIDPENATIEGDGSYIVDSDGFTGDIVVRSGNVDITLNGELRGTITVEKDAAATLDLNGNNITTTDKATDTIFNKGSLNIKGEGTVSSARAAVANAPGAACVADGGTFMSSN
ncbi:MAG: hypothetical protein ACOX4I_01450 [Anaerovoracaceae bacterium]|jgi:hypothetical protein